MLARLLLLLGTVVALCVPVAPAEAAPEPGARARSWDGRLLAGCHDYAYRYRVEDAGDDWMLELVLHDRTGEGVANTALFANDDPKRGTRTFRLCRAGTKAGRFRFTGKLTVRTGYAQTTYRAEPTTFRLRRAR